MCDLISRSAAFEDAELINWYHVNQNGKLVSGSTSDDESYVKFDDVISMLKNAPAIDAVPVVHATWIPDCETVGDDYFGYDDEWFVRCSHCGRIERDVNPYFLMDGDIRPVKQDYPYCHCGARMDGDGNG